MTEQILSNTKTNFDIRLNNAITKRNYVSRMKKFMKYCQVESYDELLFGNDPKIIQSKIVEFLRYLSLNVGVSSVTVTSYLTTITYFYNMNDITGINWKKVSKVLPEPMKVANDRPYTREEIARMLERVDDRGKVVILLMCSTGMRQGAIPTLIVGDCKKTETGIYTITVYRNSSQQYTTMCSFECAQAIDKYLEYRQRCGEKIIVTSPLIRQTFDKQNPEDAAKPRPLADMSMKNIIKYYL
jgi:site-specific recombinase XerD